MKCPNCGRTEQQQRLGSAYDHAAAYRCADCGRLYQVPAMDMAQLLDLVQELRANMDVLARRQAEFAQSIAEIEAQIRSAQAEQDG